MSDDKPIPVIVEEPAPLIWEYRCKLCQWAKTHPDLFKDLHVQVLEIGSSMARAMAYINQRIDNDKLGITKVNSQNMSTHFSAHITLPDRVNVEITKQTTSPPNLKQVVPDMGYWIEDMVRRKVGTEVTDYLNLDQLRSQIGDKLELLDTVIGSDPKEVDMKAMMVYTKLVTEIRGCVVDLNKIRQGKQLINAMIKSLIESYTMEVARQLTRDYDKIQDDLVTAGLDKSTAMHFAQNLKIRAASIMAQTARSAIEDVLRQYRI